MIKPTVSENYGIDYQRETLQPILLQENIQILSHCFETNFRDCLVEIKDLKLKSETKGKVRSLKVF